MGGQEATSINNTPFDEYNSLSNYIQNNIPQYQLNPSHTPLPPPPTSNTLSPQASTPKSKPTPDPSSRIEKRTKNTLAARRYRQKRVDQINDLELALKDTQMERDALKVRVARLEGEAEALRQMLRNRSQ